MSVKLAALDKLGDMPYPLWRDSMEQVLRHNGYWGAVAETERDADELALMDEKAFAVIMLHCTPIYQSIVRKEPSAAKA
jgi:hypothetical protein